MNIKLTCNLSKKAYSGKLCRRNEVPKSARLFDNIFVGYSPNCDSYDIYRTLKGIVYIVKNINFA